MINALEMAMKRCENPSGVIHHSDQGNQYTSQLFKEYCSELGIHISMGSVGDCYDNAMAESFFATLEYELLNSVQIFKGRLKPESALFEHIEGF